MSDGLNLNGDAVAIRAALQRLETGQQDARESIGGIRDDMRGDRQALEGVRTDVRQIRESLQTFEERVSRIERPASTVAAPPPPSAASGGTAEPDIADVSPKLAVVIKAMAGAALLITAIGGLLKGIGIS